MRTYSWRWRTFFITSADNKTSEKRFKKYILNSQTGKRKNRNEGSHSAPDRSLLSTQLENKSFCTRRTALPLNQFSHRESWTEMTLAGTSPAVKDKTCRTFCSLLNFKLQTRTSEALCGENLYEEFTQSSIAHVQTDSYGLFRSVLAKSN